MPRPSNKTQRRRQIADALLDLMAERGYAGASVSEIAARAGVNQGLVHYYFGSKLAVLIEAVGLLDVRHAERLDAAMAAAGGDPRDQLDAFINAHLGLTATADERALKCWIEVSAEAIRQPEVQAPYRVILDGLIERLSAIVAAGNAAGVFRADPAAASAAILSAILGYLVVAGTARDAIPYGTAARSTIAMARGLLMPPGDPAPAGAQ